MNRLVADQALPAEQRLTFDHNRFAAAKKGGKERTVFDPAGLIGPVSLRPYREVAVEGK